MLKIGMVGVGDISGIYLNNITKVFKNIELVAVCDLVREKAERAQAKYGVPKLYDTMQELFADPEIDMVLNLTRPSEHFEVSRQAILAGKHVYSEKPLGADLEEGLELVKLAEEKGVFLGGAPDTFLGGSIQTCRKLIDSGVVGDIVGASAFMICRGHESWHPDPEFYYKRGGGPMMDMGPYYVTALINLLGGVKSVTARTKISFPKREITSQPLAGQIIDVDADTYVAGILDFDNGAIGTLFTTFDVVYWQQARFEVYGSKGTLFVPDPNNFGDPIKLLDGKEMKDIPIEFGYTENSRGLGLADMAHAIETGEPCRVTWKQTLHALEVMTAFHKSSELGAPVEIKTKFRREDPIPQDCSY